MRKLCGYTLFCIAIGMLIGIFIENTVCLVIIILVLMLMGYNLFCC